MDIFSQNTKKKDRIYPVILMNSVVILLSVLLIIIILSAPVSAQEQNHPVYQYWTDENYPPFEFKDPSGKAAGFSVDIIRAVGEEVGFSVNATPHQWADVKAALANKTIDLSGTLIYDINRTDKFVFSVPVVTLNWYLYVPLNSTITTLRQLQGKRIILAKGDIWEEKLTNQHFPADIVIVPDYRQQLRQLSEGGYDAAILNKPVALYLMDQEGITNLKAVGEPVERMKLCIATHVSDPDLIQQIDEGIVIINRNGKYEEISRKWFEPQERKVEFEIFQKIFLFVLIPVTGLILLILFWIWMLRRVVAEKTADLKAEFSARIAAQESLHESERILTTLIDNLEGLVYRCRNDTDWTMEYLSDGVYSLTGYTPDEMTGNHTVSYGSIIHPKDQEMVWNSVQEAIQMSAPFRITYRIISKDGTIKWVWEQGRGIFRDNQLQALEGYITDISGEIKDQESLRKMGYSIEHLNEGIFWFDEQGIIIETNIAFELLIADTSFHEPGSQVRSLPFTLQSVTWEELMKEVRTSGSHLYDAMLETAESTRYFRISVSYCEFDEELVYCSIIDDRTDEENSRQDVHRQKEALEAAYEKLISNEEELRINLGQLQRAQTALEMSEKKFRALFEDSILGIFQTDTRGIFLEINSAFARMYGFLTPEEMKTVYSTFSQDMFIRPEDQSLIFQKLSKDGEIRGFESEQRQRDGSSIWISMNMQIIRDEEGDPLYYEGTVEDITRRIKAEYQNEITLRQIQRNFAELSILNDGIRNPLTVIATISESLPSGYHHIMADQICHIDNLITQLDKRWAESEKILLYLKKHHEISFKPE